MKNYQILKILCTPEDVKRFGGALEVPVTTNETESAITGDEVVSTYRKVQATPHRSSIFGWGMYWTGQSASQRYETVIGNLGGGQFNYTLAASNGEVLLPYMDRYTGDTVYVVNSQFPKMYVPPHRGA